MLYESSAHSANAFELRFQSLFQAGRAFAFPCDPEGHVDLDGFSERSKLNNLFARAMIGREFAWPQVSPLH